MRANAAVLRQFVTVNFQGFFSTLQISPNGLSNTSLPFDRIRPKSTRQISRPCGLGEF